MNEQFYSNDNKTIVLVVDTDGKEAYLKLSDRCIFFEEEEISELIKKAGIKYGFENARRTVNDGRASSKEPGKPFLIAECDPMILPGLDYDFIVPENSFLPSDYGEIALDEILKKCVVEADEPIAAYTLKSNGKAGKDIFGNEIPVPAVDGELSEQFYGEGIKCKNGTLISTVRGYPYLDKDGKISVLSLLVLKKDVTLITDCLYHIPCSAYLEGNLTGKGMIEIDGDMAVGGDIRGCTIYSAGKVLIKGNINEAVILAEGSVGLSNTVNSRIASGNNLKVENEIKQSVLIADSSISGETDCIDCSAFAGKSILLNSFIKEQKEKPVLAICFSPYSREMMNYRQEMLKKAGSVRLVSGCKDRNRNEAPPSPFSDKRNKDLLGVEYLDSKIKESENRLMKSITHGKPDDVLISVKNLLSSGVEIRVFSYSECMKSDISNVTFTSQGMR